MPWKNTCVEEQRMKFMAAYLEADSGWSMSELCEVFGVSRKGRTLRDTPRTAIPLRHQPRSLGDG
jgi:hypothetical protein